MGIHSPLSLLISLALTHGVCIILHLTLITSPVWLLAICRQIYWHIDRSIDRSNEPKEKSISGLIVPNKLAKKLPEIFQLAAMHANGLTILHFSTHHLNYFARKTPPKSSFRFVYLFFRCFHCRISNRFNFFLNRFFFSLMIDRYVYIIHIAQYNDTHIDIYSIFKLS